MLTKPPKGKGPAAQATKIAKTSTHLVQKDGQITTLKLKVKEIQDLCNGKEKELLDLKQTMKFTKIKEFETELALNVQESQRLRVLLEREMQKPRVDPRFAAGLKQ